MMKRAIGLCVLLLSVLFLCATAGAGKTKKIKVKATVRWAESWEAAITEARALNLPIIIHRHGFT